MPIHRNHYPPWWDQFSRYIRFERANQRCECRGQCGLHGGPEKARRCVELHRKPAIFAQGIIHLSVAHICNCDPPCAIPAHVIAACQRCHLRIDRALHQRHMRERGTLHTPPWKTAPKK